jgi:AcrR family transcriptional regulator
MDLKTQRMSRAESKARTRQLLLESARTVFEAKGFNAATVEEIAEGAGFTRGAFYANFADKAEALWELTADEQRSSFDEMAEAVVDRPGDEQLDVVQEWFGGAMDRRPLGRAFDELLLHGAGSEETRQRMAALLAQNRQSIVDTIQAQSAAMGVELPIPVEHLAMLMLAVGSGLGQQRHLDPEVVPEGLFADALAYLWLGVMAAGTEPALVNRRSGTSTAGRPGPGRRRS